MIVYTYSGLFDPADVSAAFIDLPEQRTVIHDVPNAIADLFETDVFAAQDLAHTFEDVRRRDGLTLLLARTATALCWFHPLAWGLARDEFQDTDRVQGEIAELLAGEVPQQGLLGDQRPQRRAIGLRGFLQLRGGARRQVPRRPVPG